MISASSRDKRRFPFLKLISSFDFGQKEKAHRFDEPSLDAVQFWFMRNRFYA